jgi:hypothetical protein
VSWHTANALGQLLLEREGGLWGFVRAAAVRRDFTTADVSYSKGGNVRCLGAMSRLRPGARAEERQKMADRCQAQSTGEAGVF